MKVSYGKDKTVYGPGVLIELSGEEVVVAISAYLVAHQIYVNGPRTIQVNGELCNSGRIYVDPSGNVTHEGKFFPGSGKNFNSGND